MYIVCLQSLEEVIFVQGGMSGHQWMGTMIILLRTVYNIQLS